MIQAVLQKDGFYTGYKLIKVENSGGWEGYIIYQYEEIRT